MAVCPNDFKVQMRTRRPSAMSGPANRLPRRHDVAGADQRHRQVCVARSRAVRVLDQDRRSVAALLAAEDHTPFACGLHVLTIGCFEIDAPMEPRSARKGVAAPPER